MLQPKYAPKDSFRLKDRRWPDQTLKNPPIWCSVDLRDGNQALPKPMNLERKLLLYNILIELGFKQIEVAFPAASEKEFNFVRYLIDNNLVPSGLAIQVITPLIDKHMQKTFEAVEGANRVIYHFYNANNSIARDHVFKKDKNEIVSFITKQAEKIIRMGQDFRGEQLIYQYTPEHFNITEMDLVCEIALRLMEIIKPNQYHPLIFNLASSMEVYAPNIFADRVEYFCRQFGPNDPIIVSIHPHNDRGCALAAAELGLLAGAKRVEGTLFGNGERAGNLDLITLALNLYTIGINPDLKIKNITKIKDTVQRCIQYNLSPRHPYVGELAFTAFSGTHQDAISKGLTAFGTGQMATWQVPYLPLDPRDINLDLDAVICINSQSGFAGIKELIKMSFGAEAAAILTKEQATHWLRHIAKIEDNQTQAEIHKYIKDEFAKLLQTSDHHVDSRRRAY